MPRLTSIRSIVARKSVRDRAASSGFGGAQVTPMPCGEAVESPPLRLRAVIVHMFSTGQKETLGPVLIGVPVHEPVVNGHQDDLNIEPNGPVADIVKIKVNPPPHLFD